MAQFIRVVTAADLAPGKAKCIERVFFYTDLVGMTVDSVEALHGGTWPNQLYIHPDECIDCGACEPECPWGAIFARGD